MKRVFAAVALIVLIYGGLLFFNRAHQRASETPLTLTNTTAAPVVKQAAPPAVNSTVPNPSPPPASSTNLAAQAGQVLPDPSPPPVLPPEMVLQNVRRAVHQFGEMFGGNPVGTNPEITAALTGKNPKGINFLQGVPGMSINENGELVDPWGTPYFFHQLSGTVMELHSAGPDRKMWTSDDLVIQ